MLLENKVLLAETLLENIVPLNKQYKPFVV